MTELNLHAFSTFAEDGRSGILKQMDRVALRTIAIFAALYFLLFAALGAEVPFIPQLLASAGLPASEVGLVLSAGTIAQVLAAPLFGHVADRLGARLVLTLAALAAAASLVLLLVASGGLTAALLVYVLFAIASALLNPLADTLAVPACAKAGIPYGRVRGVGSVGFFVGILLSSAIAARLGTSSVVMTSAVFFILMTAVLPRLRPAARPSRQAGPPDGLGSLLRIRAFRRVLLVAALVIGSHAMSDAFAVIHWHTIGIPTNTIGIMLAAAVASECFVFVVLGPVLLRVVGPSACVAIGAITGAVRWAVLAETPSVGPVLATQLLHGLTFSLVHLACMEILGAVVPRRVFATAQSLYGICSNSIASAVVTLAAGVLFGTLHAHAFWLASTLCAIALPIAFQLDMGAPWVRVKPAKPHRPTR